MAVKKSTGSPPCASHTSASGANTVALLARQGAQLRPLAQRLLVGLRDRAADRVGLEAERLQALDEPGARAEAHLVAAARAATASGSIGYTCPYAGRQHKRRRMGPANHPRRQRATQRPSSAAWPSATVNARS